MMHFNLTSYRRCQIATKTMRVLKTTANYQAPAGGPKKEPSVGGILVRAILKVSMVESATVVPHHVGKALPERPIPRANRTKLMALPTSRAPART